MRALALAAVFALACSSSATSATTFPDAPYVTTTFGAYHVELRTAPSQPPVRGAFDALLSIRDGTAASSGLAVKVTPWMPAMGHGSSTTPIVTPGADGDYVISNLVLPMPGMWELRVSIDGGQESVLSLDVQ